MLSVLFHDLQCFNSKVIVRIRVMIINRLYVVSPCKSINVGFFLLIIAGETSNYLTDSFILLQPNCKFSIFIGTIPSSVNLYFCCGVR